MAQPRPRTSPLRAPCIAVLVPVALALLVAWPVLALATLVPVVGLVSFPTLLSCTASLFLVLPATLHLVLAQPDSPNPPLVPRVRLLSPLANLRLLHWVLLVLHDAYASSIFALALETLTRRVLLVGGRDAHGIIRENIAYAEGPDGASSLRLDVYLPQPRRARRGERDDGDDGAAASELAPVVVVLPSPSYRLLSLSRTFPSPLIAHRLARLGPTGALVVVPSLSGAQGHGAAGQGVVGIERAVGETRAALEWVAEHAGAYGADAERCTVLGYGAGAHVGLLTLVQSAIVCAREALLGAADEEKEEEGADDGDVARAEVERAQLGVDDGATSSGGGTPRRRGESSSADYVPVLLPRDTSIAPSSSHTDRQTDSDRHSSSSPASPTRQPPSPSSSSSSRSSSSFDLDAAIASADTGTRRPTALAARDVPSGVRACRLWTLAPSSGGAQDGVVVVEDEPEYGGEALASFALPRRRGGGRLRVQGVVLVGGTYDVVKQGRWLEGWGAGDVSNMARFCHDDERDILQACPSHLLYAASPLLARSLSSSSATTTTPPLPSLLPPRFLLIHGGRDPLVPFSQATLLRNLLVGIGVGEARLRLCRDEGGLGALATLMRPTRYSPLVMREIEHIVFDPVGDEEGAREGRTSGARRRTSRRAG
ncbi:uncharacterized protein RHOBADRAFT_56297 [Rhodotorula graminis WP1]|uniref:Carboxylesterase type B domain-containing protein n=1 Tax=Rhodotorula graminis (strain WP1) TaxID=578459 RepID=A0A0P9ER63_RHOGW|nr:uncharacterized protein RHOBADRAFT_56297 [Rhodotorula graminis WP1]KPV71918.1 hypothetical protein RHOBADRAFT_56297 [Rhodotorula graminis WP1]